MKRTMDLREYKAQLRIRYRGERQRLTFAQKTRMDSRILDRLCRLNQYVAQDTILTYVSKAIEVDTLTLINHALAQGKRVAVPKCVAGKREMHFYFIDSLDDLTPGIFGVLEPQGVAEKKVVNMSEGICIVPGFCFDLLGYRLGYGKGYYDRFLSHYSGVKAGLCYSNGVVGRLRHGRFDCPVDVLVTEQVVRRTVQ